MVSMFLFFSLVVSGLLAWRGRRELLDLSASYDGVLRQQDEQTEVLQQQVWLRSGQRLLAEKVVGQSTPALVGARHARISRALSGRGGGGAVCARQGQHGTLRGFATTVSASKANRRHRISRVPRADRPGRADAPDHAVCGRAGRLREGRLGPRHECAEKSDVLPIENDGAGQRRRRTRLYPRHGRARSGVPATDCRRHGRLSWRRRCIASACRTRSSRRSN